jgi:hypothetical protein
MTAKCGAVVVVPACNESSLLSRCLKAIRAAAAGVAVPVSVVVVLDACDDESVSLARRSDQISIFLEVDERNVGAATPTMRRWGGPQLSLRPTPARRSSNTQCGCGIGPDPTVARCYRPLSGTGCWRWGRWCSCEQAA